MKNNNNEERKCISCEGIIKEEDECGYYDAGCVCSNCEDQDQESAGTIMKYNGETQTARIGEYTEYSEEDFSEEAIKLFGRPEWHSTDGWRGYYEFSKKPKGLTLIADGWITGWIDNTIKYKQPTIDVFNELQSAKEAGEDLPFVIYWVFCPTSNVFSTASDVYVDNEKSFKNWIEKRTKIKLNDFKKSFN